jgi:DNA-binding NarL/FixJ family response regulator
MNETIEDQILQELKRISRVQVLIATRGQTQKDSIVDLARIGFQPKEIADLLGTTPNTVSVALSTLKKKTKSVKNKQDD